MNAASFDRPYVISWNLTYRCNLACEHCYLDAGGLPQVTTEGFADRSELTTEQCFRVIDDIAGFAPECLLILTGGEPLLRRDILEIVRYAAGKDLWVVVGTNGVKISENLAGILKREGVRGLALSLDALDAERHDAFRRVRGAWSNTVEGAKILSRTDLPFIVQTTVGRHNAAELSEIAEFAHSELHAKVWNLYFLVPTGRGEFVSDMSPAEYDGVLADLHGIQRKYAGKMFANAKCAPHYIKTVFEKDPDGTSPFFKTFSGGAGGCPAGTHYLGIRPNGDVTPCPYLPVFGGNLRTGTLGEIWKSSEPFVTIRKRDSLGDRCGACEFNPTCGGCRARAYGVTGDVLAEDPLCTHEPGTYDASRLLSVARIEYGARAAGADGVGADDGISIRWESDARDRMKQIPAFVRGMVTRSVESYCRRNGVSVVTPTVLEEIRKKMPTRRIFGGTGGES